MAEFKFTDVKVAGIASAIPKNHLYIKQLYTKFSEDERIHYQNFFGVEKIHKSIDAQTTSDLGFQAAETLLTKKHINREEIGAIVFLSTTPDYRGPATALVLQHRLNLSKDCLAYDINLGGAGFIYGLQLGAALVKSLNKSYALFITGDTSSKQVNEGTISSILYGDACSAILLEKTENAVPIIISSKASGTHLESMIIKGGAFRTTKVKTSRPDTLEISIDDIHKFIKDHTEPLITQFLSMNSLQFNSYDVIILPQSGKNLLNTLIENLGITQHNTPTNFEMRGDTRGSAIPLLLTDKYGDDEMPINRIRILACAYGEGLSWGVSDFSISTNDIIKTIESDDFYQHGAVSHDI